MAGGWLARSVLLSVVMVASLPAPLLGSERPRHHQDCGTLRDHSRGTGHCKHILSKAVGALVRAVVNAAVGKANGVAMGASAVAAPARLTAQLSVKLSSALSTQA